MTESAEPRPSQGQPHPQGQPDPQGSPAPGPGAQPGSRAGGPVGGPVKSPLLIIGMVVAAVVALVAIGGIAIGLGSGSREVPVTTITPGPQTPPSDEPSTDASDAAPSSGDPSGSASPGGAGSAAEPVDLGHDVTLVPADGWEVRKQTASLAQLGDGNHVFVGQTAQLDAGTNPGQACTAWHEQLAGDEGGGEFSTPRTADVGSDDLRAATCSAQVTVSSGQGSSTLLLVSVVSVRDADGLTVIGTAALPKRADQDQLSKDFGAMSGSMLESQAGG